MNRSETLAAINALPVSDAVKAHACRLVEGLPEWVGKPDEHIGVIVPETAILTWCEYRYIHRQLGTEKILRRLDFFINDDRGAPVIRYSYSTQGAGSIGGPITDRDVHELLRQFSGMVALTGGG